MNIMGHQRQIDTVQVRRPNPRNRLYMMIGCAVVIVVGLALLFLSRSQTPKPASAAAQSAPVATVTTSMVGFAPVQTKVVASGSIAPQHAVDVGAEVSGLRIVEVNVDEGDQVRQGQVLARLNSDILQAQLDSLQAQLQAKRANVSKARQPNR